jgi:hypothetical protein
VAIATFLHTRSISTNYTFDGLNITAYPEVDVALGAAEYDAQQISAAFMAEENSAQINAIMAASGQPGAFVTRLSVTIIYQSTIHHGDTYNGGTITNTYNGGVQNDSGLSDAALAGLCVFVLLLVGILAALFHRSSNQQSTKLHEGFVRTPTSTKSAARSGSLVDSSAGDVELTSKEFTNPMSNRGGVTTTAQSRLQQQKTAGTAKMEDKPKSLKLHPGKIQREMSQLFQQRERGLSEHDDTTAQLQVLAGTSPEFQSDVKEAIENFREIGHTAIEDFIFAPPKKLSNAAGSFAKKKKVPVDMCRARLVVGGVHTARDVAFALKGVFEARGFTCNTPKESHGQTDASKSWWKVLVTKPLVVLNGSIETWAEVQICDAATHAFLADHSEYEKVRGYGPGASNTDNARDHVLGPLPEESSM